MKKIYYLLLCLFIFSGTNSMFAQVGISNASPKGALDITSANDGLLIPRIALLNTATATVITPTVSELVYNTATINDVTPGFYYWDGAMWVKLQAGPKTAWELTGNAGTASTDYLGTTDARDLRLSTTGVEKMRVLANGQIVVNNIAAPIAGDRFSVYNTTVSDFAISGYSTVNGVGIFGQNTGTGVAIFGNNSSTGAGILGITNGATSAGVFGRADVAGGSAVYGTSNGASAAGVEGFSSGGSGTGVYGTATGNLAAGVFGNTNVANGSGIWGNNANASGTGVLGSGNNQAASYLIAGTGGAFTGASGAVGFARTAAGTGMIGAGNNLGASTLVGGSGGAFTGTQWGVFAYASISGFAGTDRAAFVGNFNETATARTVYVGARIGGVNYKVLGTGSASVSTTMPTRDGERVLFAPEAPENWFFDIGEVLLVDGKATVSLDPLFIDCIADSKPFKVFVQAAEDTFGSIRVTRNQSAKTFTLEDMGGLSNGIVQYSVYAIWRQKENIRFPEYHTPSSIEHNESKEILAKEMPKEKTNYSEPKNRTAQKVQ